MPENCTYSDCNPLTALGLCRDHTWQVVNDQQWPGWAHKVLENLRIEPIPRLAVNKADISMSSFHRLKAKSLEYAEAVDVAVGVGASHVLNLQETKGGKSKSLWVLNRLPIDDFRDPEKRLDRDAQKIEEELREVVDLLHDIILRHGGPALQELSAAVDTQAARLLPGS